MNADQAPAETFIFYSKFKSILLMTIGLVTFCFGLYLTIMHKQVSTGIMECIVGAVIGGIGLAWYLNGKPQLIISNSGIESSKFPLINWRDISYESVERRRKGRVIAYYLSFNTPDGAREVRINLYNIKPDELENLLKLYRCRFEQHNRHLN